MKTFAWNDEKNNKLKLQRGVSFELIVLQIEAGKILDILEHSEQTKYSGQRILVVDVDDYAFLVPFIETEEEIFLKTIIPSRKATKKYIKRQEDE